MKIEPFRIAIEREEVQALKQRLRATRWPTPIGRAGWAQGMDAGYLASLADYWLKVFDFSSMESHLNRVPQFRVRSDQGWIHFVHLRADRSDAVPIVLTHGWPSTFAELLTLGDMLANPVAHGANATVAFDVVIPSLPGYCFSSAPKELGTNLFAIATQWAQLMSALEYPKFIAQGGDFGAGISTALGLRHADRLLGLHLNFIPGSYQPSVPEDRALSSEETRSLANRAEWFEREGGYAHIQRTKPDTLGPALNDSPIGLAAWIVDKFRSWSDCDGQIERRFSYDEILTTVSLYWFTRSMPSAMRLYWENLQQPLKLAARERIAVPVAIAHFPRELPIPARAYVERGYNVIRWSEMPRGGHFAALEEPELLAEDIRAFAGML